MPSQLPRPPLHAPLSRRLGAVRAGVPTVAVCAAALLVPAYKALKPKPGVLGASVAPSSGAAIWDGSGRPAEVPDAVREAARRHRRAARPLAGRRPPGGAPARAVVASGVHAGLPPAVASKPQAVVVPHRVAPHHQTQATLPASQPQPSAPAPAVAPQPQPVIAPAGAAPSGERLSTAGRAPSSTARTHDAEPREPADAPTTEPTEPGDPPEKPGR